MERRSTYVARGRQEKFIVPLLSSQVLSLLSIVKDRVTRARSVRVLDVGCGEQPLRSVVEESGWSYYGLDIQQNKEGTVDFIERIDGPLQLSEAYDLVICTEVLEHVLDWHQAFKNLNKLVVEDGYVLITSPFFYPPHEVPYDYWRPTQYTFLHFAAQFNFEIIEARTAGDFWDVLGTAIGSSFINRSEHSFAARLRFKVLAWLMKYLNNELTSGRIRRYANAKSEVYLSNVVLLRKRP